MRSKHTASAGWHTSIFPSGSIVLTLLKCLEITWDNLDLECRGTELGHQIPPESSAMPLWLKVTTPLVSIPSRKCSSLISLLGSAKITSCQFPPCSLYHKQSIGLTGNFRIWNRFFPKWEFSGRAIYALSIRAFSGKNSRLTEVPFWEWPEGIFHFITRMPYRGLFLIL